MHKRYCLSCAVVSWLHNKSRTLGKIMNITQPHQSCLTPWQWQSCSAQQEQHWGMRHRGGIKSTRHKTLSHHHKQTTEGTFSASIVWLQTAALVERGELLFTLCFPCRFKQRAIKLYRGHCLFLYTNAVLRVKDVRNNLSTPSDILMYSLCLLLSPSGSRALNKNDLHHTEEDGADQQNQPFYTTENYTNVS